MKIEEEFPIGTYVISNSQYHIKHINNPNTVGRIVGYMSPPPNPFGFDPGPIWAYIEFTFPDGDTIVDNIKFNRLKKISND